MTDVNLTYSVGTCSVAVSGTTVTGVSTLWGQSANVRQWDLISIDGGPLTPITASPADDTHLTIPAWASAVKSGVGYVIYQVSPLRFVGGQAMADVDDMLAKLNTDGWYRYVNPAYSDPTAQGITANEGQFALKYTTGEVWIMTSGAWVLVGTFKAFGVAAPYDNTKTYSLQDVVTSGGSSYVWINATSGSGHAPPNATYWAVLASIGSTGAVPLTALSAWVTSTAYVSGPPASYVSQGGSSYECLVAHTSGTFATDIAAGKWGIVASKGVDGNTYGGSSTTSLAIATGSTAFTGVATNLAYQVGNYVRASSAAGGANFMEGPVTGYTGGTLTLNVSKTGGSGTHADWNLSVSGAPGTGDILSTNNGSDFANVDTTLANLHGVSFASQALTSAQRTQARTNIGSPISGHLFGLTLSTAGSSSTFGIAAGDATDSTNIALMALASAYTKTRTSWAVGSGNGALDSGGGTAASTWYHVFLIQRPDTGVVDVLISLSATSPTLPTNYTLFRRIGSMLSDGSANWVLFSQNGDEFLWSTVPTEINGAPSITTATNLQLTVPTGIKVNALLNAGGTADSSTSGRVYISSLDGSDQTGVVNVGILAANTNAAFAQLNIRTSTAGQIRIRMDSTGSKLFVGTAGWIDTRGRLG